MHAVAKDDIGVTTTLLQQGANPNVMRSGGGGTLLYWAADRGNPKMVSLLIAHGADPNLRGKNGQTPLLVCANNGNTKISRILIDAGANVNLGEKPSRFTPLMYAVQRGHKETAAYLIKSGADLNAKTWDGFGRAPSRVEIRRVTS